MLKLINIKKDYVVGNEKVPALRGINLDFRENEFVSVLGPSGCGKTTLLNIIGGLDKYTSGDLLIDGKSTKDFSDGEWDSYRNKEIGIVFQNYNLISHLSVLENVSIAMTLSGVGITERNERAKQALMSVGLESQFYKRPNQLSGGQMQRVAIARALVNNPRILLCDEPTGALDTKISVQIMEILKKISENHLVVMVTHNEKLAEAYSDRIIRLIDGEVADDSNKLILKDEKVETKEKLTNKKTSMSFVTAIRHSFKNLMTKKARTVITAIAGSIGILGIALVLSISNGMSSYIQTMQSDTLAGFPLTISKTTTANRMDGMLNNNSTNNGTAFTDKKELYSYDSSANRVQHTNLFTNEYIAYLNNMDSSLYNSITYSYGIGLNVLVKTDTGSYIKLQTSQSSSRNSSILSEMPNNESFIASQYDYLYGNFPSSAYEVALVVDKSNHIDINVLNQLGININETYSFDDLIGRELKVMPNNTYYAVSNEGVYSERNDYANLYNDENSITLKITAIMRVNESASTELLSTGIVYTKALTDMMLEDAQSSNIVSAQKTYGNTKNVLTGDVFNAMVTYESVMLEIGADTSPTGIQIYPKDFSTKETIKEYLDSYNTNKAESEQIVYTDMAETISSMTSTLINTITIILSAFAGISLVVSSIMIGIITYVSVIERTKEIGILRAIGARKKDISRLFNAETIIIGFTSGIIGIILALLLSLPINAIVSSLVGVSNIAKLSITHAIILIVLSMALTFIAGLFPSRIAAKKDPVLALRTE